MKNSIFTNNIFPGKVFKKTFNFYLTYEFETFFSKEFVKSLHSFCVINQVINIELQSLDTFLPFNFTIETKSIDNNYLDFFQQQREFPEQTHSNCYHFLTSNFVIYLNKPDAAFYINRGFELAVLGFDNTIDITPFKTDALNMPVKKYFEAMRFKENITRPVAEQFTGKEYFFT